MIELENHIFIQADGVAIFEAKEVSPVIISVPHDGMQSLGMFKTRATGFKGRDKCVWDLVKDITSEVPTSVVRGLMPRSLIDYNRAWPQGVNYYPKTQKDVHTAIDDERLLPFYQSYHHNLGRLIENAIIKYGQENILLIDFHGFSKNPPYSPPDGFDIIIGTGNRASILYGEIDRQMASFMESRNYKIFLPKDLSLGPEEDWYSADYTTRHYSNHYRINAIQAETAHKFRDKSGLIIGQKFSKDFSAFIRQFFF